MVNSDLTFEDSNRKYNAVIRDLANELLDIALSGLVNIAAEEGYESEARYLAPLEVLTRRGKCPADESVSWFKRTPKNARDLVGHYA